MIVSVVALATGVVTLAMAQNRPVFILDEWSYADYLHKIDDGLVWMPPGEMAGQEVIADVACRGTEPEFFPQAPPCGQTSYDPAAFLNSGVNSASIHPPTYFLVTWAGAKTILATGVTDDLITAGRLVGIIWMAAGLLGLLLLLRELRVHPVAQALAVLLVATTPRFVEQWQYLTPDAANMLLGSVVLLAALRWLRGASRWWLLPVAGAFATAVKAPNVLVVCLAALVLVLSPSALYGVRKRVLGAAMLLGGALATGLAVLVVRALLAPADLPPSDLDLAQRADAFSPLWLADNVAAFLSPFGRPGTAVYGLSVVAVIVVVGLAAAAAVYLPSSDRRQRLAVATAVMLVLGPLLLVVLTYATSHQYFPMRERYGYTLFPAVVALAAGALRTRGQLAAAAAFTGLYGVGALAALG